MASKYLLLLIPCLLLTTKGLGQAPPAARPLAEFFSSLTGKQLRKLSDSRDSIEKAQTSKELDAILNAKEAGKKATLKFTSSGKAMIVMNNQISLSGDPDRSVVRVNGETIRVCVVAEVPPTMEDKVKQCREGRKVFVSGTVKSISISYSAALMRTSDGRSVYGPNRFTAGITVAADDFGLDK
jgi:hypothetical protein